MVEEYKEIVYNGTTIRCYREGYISLYLEKAGSRPSGWFKTFGTISDQGYMRVRIGLTVVGVHKLINLAFNGETFKDGLVTDHINRIKNDNRVENLRWVTTAENIANCEYQDTLTMHRREGKNITILKPNGKTSSRLVPLADFEKMKCLKLSDRYEYIKKNGIECLHACKTGY